VRVGAGRPAQGVAAALTSSGTSTAELAVDLVPMAVYYRMGVVGRLARPLLVTSPWIALANLLCGGPVVPERLVGAGGAAAMARDLSALLRDPVRWSAAREALRGARERVAREGVADRAARAVLS
jgi:lipid A disaccharide synthetase